MQPYANLSGDSGITAYEIGPDFVVVEFHDRKKLYAYTAAKVGRTHVERMKRLAAAGRGLGTYINQHPKVKNGYVLVARRNV